MSKKLICYSYNLICVNEFMINIESKRIYCTHNKKIDFIGLICGIKN